MQHNDSRFAEIIDADAKSVAIAQDFDFTEGPIWHPREGHVTFSDIPANRLYRYTPGGGVVLYREPSNMANGNTYDRQGRMLSCEHATSRVTREEGGVLSVLASHYDGKELNSPNDIVVARDGRIFFTDPTYGRQAHTGVVRHQVLDFQGVYRIDPDGTLTLLTKDFAQPNGLCLDLDEQHLYVADTVRRHIRKFRLEPDGTLAGGTVFCESPAPDGLKTDSLGNVYTGGPRGVHVYHRDDGAFLGVIGTPGFCANFCWGGDDLRTLYLTSSKAFLQVRVEVPGLALF
jgi:gluconolactonase